MFANLKKGNTIYILTKSDKPTVQVGQIEAVKEPTPKYPTQYNVPQYGTQPEMLMDIVVRCDETTHDFKQIQSNVDVFEYPSVKIYSRKDALLSDIEGLMQHSQQIIESKPYHEGLCESYQGILKQLSPQYAKDAEWEQKIGALENNIGTLKSDIGDIKSLLAKIAQTSGKTSKNNNNGND